MSNKNNEMDNSFFFENNEEDSSELKDMQNKKVDPQLEEYIASVKLHAESKSDLVFDNSNQTHASVVLSVMLENANKEFCLFDKDLSGDVADKYKEFFPTLLKFVEKGKLLKVIILNDDYKDTNIYKILKELSVKYPDNVYVRKLNSNPNNTKQYFNFAVADSVSFRLEKSFIIDNNRKAICCFNSPTIALKLKKLFENEYNNCINLYQ